MPQAATEAADVQSVHGSSSKRGKTVVIVGPPWPRSGTARVIQNQIEYYRERGYFTVFICVPVHCSYTDAYSDWDQIKIGMQELGADQVLFATINPRRFLFAKYANWIAKGFRGTALDWIVFTAASAQLPEESTRLLRGMNIELINVNHVFTLGYAQRLVRQVIPSGHSVPVILETHDIQSNLLHERREMNGWTHRLDSVQRLLQSELALLDKVRVLVHCSVDDFNFFRHQLPGKRHILALPSIDETFLAAVAAARPVDDPIDLLFVGQSTDPNCAAMKWFFEEVWPLIADRGYRLKIVGQVDMLVRKNLPDLYDRFRAHFVGPVADLAPYYKAARCVFAPMVSGTGISMKTGEALALGMPFVGASKAFRGMPMDRIEQAGLRAHDTPRDFAEAIVQTLASEGRSAAASRAAYNAVFSKQAVFASRDEALRVAVGARISGPETLSMFAEK